jgi:hypothetical protein
MHVLLVFILTHTDAAVLRASRSGVIGCIRNCCFSSVDHEWMLGPQVDILPHLLLPLVGPEEMDEDDMNGMPDELQVTSDDLCVHSS